MKSSFEEFMEEWIKYLNNDPALQWRIKQPFFYSGDWPFGPGTGPLREERMQELDVEGKELVELTVPEGPYTYTIELREGKFRLKQDKAKKPLLSWTVPLALLKDTLTKGMEFSNRLVYILLDERCKLSFNTSEWSKPNGTTVFEVLVCAQELAEKNTGMRKIIKNL